MRATSGATVRAAPLARPSRKAPGDAPRPTAEDRRRRRNDDRRRLILEAAAAEFADHGFENATLADIADRVGLSKASLYYYVESKEQLLVALVDGLRKDVEARAAASTGDARARLRAFVRAHVEIGCTSTAGRLLVTHGGLLKSKESAAARRRYEAIVRKILEAGIASGELAEMPIGPIVKFLVTALNAIPTWFDPKGAMTLDELSDTFASMVLTGLTRRGR